MSPRAWCAKIPDRAGLLYAGTEFGMYVSFDNGAHWQSFQLNLPVTPVTDIKVAHKDLVLSTQGRSFWILDNLTPLHQWAKSAASQTVLFDPAAAVRASDARPHGRPEPGQRRVAVSARGSDDRLLSGGGACGRDQARDTGWRGQGGAQRSRARRRLSERAASAPMRQAGTTKRRRLPRQRCPARLEKTAGMHRFTWDLRYPGPWMSKTRPEGPNGPVAVPGKYSVRLTAGAFHATQPLTVVEDPRIVKAGVTTADLREQFEHNLRVANW